MAGNILIIDDEEQLRKLLSRIISLEGFAVEQAGTLKVAWDLLARQEPEIVLCDVKLPDGDGVRFVKELKEKHPLVEIILLTAFGNIPDGVQAIKNGAFDYITKGNDNDRIVPLLHQAYEKAIAGKKAAVKIKVKGAYTFNDIIGAGPLIKDAVQLAQKIAPTNANVLLLGETGTGKEVFANAIHAHSNRNDKAIVAINCSAFARDLLEGELFGHKAGAYTGATKDKKGLIELADGGTLFLDEIGEMNIDLQAKLLRVIENGEFIKLGDVKTTKVNVRIIAATHRNLVKMIEEASFREDLYYRLNVFTISLPPLRDHAEDIPELARHFLAYYAARENKPVLHISNAALQLLKQHNWKGNIRELRNVLERATIMTDGDTIQPEHLPFEIQKQSAGSASLTLASVEKDHIVKVLRYTNGNKTRTAALLAIGLTTLYRKIEEYKIL
ncbi:sigma-54-dependent transcriptional regulator [Longitalea arenae]|uniref:sigma-54-dependent transcriptional regulator n=1 Tax=Longitalea arenae TaxID=2812558 RepID=UPI0019679039|nr:sigma-54 dependent transcriptional regulator [Longitalea arenae]